MYLLMGQQTPDILGAETWKERPEINNDGWCVTLTMTNWLNFSAQSSGGTWSRSGFLPVKRIFWSGFCSPFGGDVCLFVYKQLERTRPTRGGLEPTLQPATRGQSQSRSASK